MIWWFFLQTFSLNFQNVRICLTFDFYEGKRFFLSVTSEFERIDGLTSLMGTVWVKALFFLYFRLLFSFRISNQDFIRLKSDSIILITWFNTFLRIFGWYFECFRVGVFKSLENWKILHLGAVKSYNMTKQDMIWNKHTSKLKQDMIWNKHTSNCPRTYQCPQVSVYFERATCLLFRSQVSQVI